MAELRQTSAFGSSGQMPCDEAHGQHTMCDAEPALATPSRAKRDEGESAPVSPPKTLRPAPAEPSNG